ncbi:GNAT family N-acetyltransferase [Bacillus spongiae]|uniref:GNAT family N-acetyltransferase n=1 Tax=Bacillus spongiae TaxID=2683610 RepID=A0ABU8HCB8_9BACI
MKLHLTKEVNERYKKNIQNKLYEFNVKHLPEDLRGRYEEVNVFLLDDDKNVHGGILGEICWNWLEIHILMMDEELRGKGYGTKLLLEMERAAKENKCDFIKVDTLSFQALDFYRDNGYEIYGTLDGVGRDYKHFYLRKDI